MKKMKFFASFQDEFRREIGKTICKFREEEEEEEIGRGVLKKSIVQFYFELK